MATKHWSEMSQSEKDGQALAVQESILADLEELVISAGLQPKRTIEEAVYHRIAELKKTIKMLKASLAKCEE